MADYQGDPSVERLAFVESHESESHELHEYDSSVGSLTITTPSGECFMQGEEADTVHDELEACETWEGVVQVLTAYDDVCE